MRYGARVRRYAGRYTFPGRRVIRRRLFWATFWAAFWLTALFGGGKAQTGETFSVAVLPPQATDDVGDAVGDLLWPLLEQALTRAGLTVAPRAQVRSAVGDGPFDFNPTCADAQALGARIGSEGYVMVALRRGARSTADRRTVVGGTLHLFAVETRTGRLSASEHADFTEDGTGFDAAVKPLAEAAAARFAAAWRTARARLTAAAGRDGAESDALDLRTGAVPPDATPPVPLTRIRPEPTEAARAAGVAATVGVEVYVTENGEAAGVDIVRWAGYGLEAAVEAALRATRFRPATYNGKPVAARFLAEFNFRAPKAP